MSIAGIVAEYNPFHNGHAYHLRETRRALGEDTPLICVMSGDFVQRGEAAAYDKFTRAECACRSGVNLVFELPLPWCLASAEGFARGAVSILHRLGCTHLSFGSEVGEIEPLERLAETLCKPGFHERVKAQLAIDASLGYAAARERAVSEKLGEEAKLLGTPNNILAVEYLKAMREVDAKMRPMTVKRAGSRHDGEGDMLASALELRRMLYQGINPSGMIPETALSVLNRKTDQGRGLPDRQLIEAAVISRLRMLKEEDFERLPDAADGLGRRLYRAAREEPTIEAVMETVKTKRYTMSRVRRMICHAALGISAGMTADRPPYARLLAADSRGCELLRELQKKAEIPVLIKPAAVRELGEHAMSVFELGSSAHDLYVLGYSSPESRRGTCDWRASPVIL